MNQNLEKKSNKKWVVVAVLSMSLLGSAFLIPSLDVPQIDGGAFVYLSWTSDPDQFGQYIDAIDVYQWEGGSWTRKGLVESGDTDDVVNLAIDEKVRFLVYVWFNNTLVGADNSSHGSDLNRVYVQIDESDGTDILALTEMTTEGRETTDPPFWYYEHSYEWDDSPKPENGVTYNCTFVFQVYY